MANKRKANGDIQDSPSKKRQIDIRAAFRKDLFQTSTLDKHRNAYAQSGPYPHAVVPSLVEDGLLRAVRSEITDNIHFTLKETDIYRIHQSGDLANLSKLDKESLRKLPSLVHLRDALYSAGFREWVSDVTGAGKLSGKKTDMAVNVYTPGSYLLCHDDVIGSRRVSYILYLTDPDNAWKSEWGGGLRLYPTEQRKNTTGEAVKVPLAEHSLNIPPGFGQLSFFTVVPGESYHDVEEVYHAKTAHQDQERIRMAISGWYHIPQQGEEGFEEGLEQSLAQKSSLTQLKSASSEFDEPQMRFRHFDEPRIVMNSNATDTEIDPGDDSDEDEDLTEQDLTFLLLYIRAQFLAPDMVGQIAEEFKSNSMVQLEAFLNDKFSTQVKEYLETVEKTAGTANTEDDPSSWKIARPPHKHRYAYYQEDAGLSDDSSPVSRLLIDLLHSHAFKKWLALITGLKPQSLTKQNAVARRFRRGKDYALASPFAEDQPQVEFTIGLTPSNRWEDSAQQQDKGNHSATSNGHSTSTGSAVQVDITSSDGNFGGEEIYMAGDDDDDSIHSKSLPHVGRKADPAVYKAADDDEDGILFANAPGWNILSIVLRDKGTLRFVKYISEAAKGDRWDIKGEVQLSEDAFDGEDDESDAGDDEDNDDNGHDDDGDDNDDSEDGDQYDQEDEEDEEDKA